jgi:hypothetical protein
MALVCAAGCLWRSYGTIMAVHVDVLTQTATKLESMARAGRRPVAEDMAEYTYPAKRAREFLRQFDGYRTRPSYQHFSTLVDRYEAMVREADAARTMGGDWSAVVSQLTAENAALQQLGAEVRSALRAE